MKIPLVLLACLACWSGSARAQTLVRTVTGAAGDIFGSAVIRAGDMDGDGFGDLLVGAPGQNNRRGAIHCISGSYLASGGGAIHIWSIVQQGLPGFVPEERFGTALVAAGNLVGNSVPDFVIGAPEIPLLVESGFVAVVGGSTRTVVSIKGSGAIPGLPQGAGQALANMGDLDGDGKAEIAIGMPNGANNGVVIVATGASLANHLVPLVSGAYAIFSSVPGYGTSLAAADVNGDGDRDLVIGSPLAINGTGLVETRDIGGPTTFTATYSFSQVGAHLGQSVDAADDYDGDGKREVIVGAPDHPGGLGLTAGRAYVLSGAKLAANQSPAELYVIPGSVSGGFGWRFGAAVRASRDLNNDGTGDFVVGSPSFSLLSGLGAATVFSGKTGMRLGGLSGASNERLGDAVLGALDDLDGDGFEELIVAGGNGDNPTTDCGSIKCYRLFPASASTYCTAKVNSLGCTPLVSSTGLASKSSPSPFSVNCASAVNKKSGLLLYSHMPSATAFQGGFLCVKTPLKRVGAQTSGGSTTGNDCTGTFAFDFNALIQGGTDPSLVVGAQLFCQYWSRDPQSPSGTSLSNGVRFLINP